MTSNVTIALTFIMCLNVFMWLGQVTVTELNPESPLSYFHCEGSMIDNYGSCESYSLSEPTDLLPSAEKSVSPTTGNIFTDVFSSIKTWFLDLPGVNMVVGIVKAPYHLLKAMNIPEEISFALGVFWYAITLFLIVAFFWGRE